MYSSTTITVQGRAGWSAAIAGSATEERVGARDGVESGLELADEVPRRQPAQQLFVFRSQAGVAGPASPAALLDQLLADAHVVSLPQLGVAPRPTPSTARGRTDEPPILLSSHLLLAATLIVTASQRPARQLGTPVPP
jgi:hypothetical protein